MATKAEVKKHDHEQWVKLNRYAQDLVFVFEGTMKKSHITESIPFRT